MWGGKESLERHRNISEILSNDPILRNSHHAYDMTREEKIEHAYAKLNRLLEIKPEEITYKNILYYTSSFLGIVIRNFILS